MGRKKQLPLPSSATIEYLNLKRFGESWEVIKKFDNDMWFVKQTLDTYPIDPLILPPLIRTLYRMSRQGFGSNWGKVTITIQDGNVSSVFGEQSRKIDIPLIRKEKT